jgi:hypothetical protein
MREFRRPFATFAVLVAAATACGLPSVPPRATTAPDPGPAQRTTAASSAAPDPPSAPFVSPIDRLIYRVAFDRCSISRVDGAARDYGGDASDPTTVANAYARFASPDHIQPAYQGCLDGLQAPRS